MTSCQKNFPVNNNARSDVLARLTPPEFGAVLRILLERHKDLRAETERIATELMAVPSLNDIAENVFEAVTSLDLDDLNSRAGKTQWGYVEPSEAAWELLEESVADTISDMKRRMELGLTDAATTICCGIVKGLNKAEDVHSDGVLDWATDFPAEEAGHAVAEFMSVCPTKIRQSARSRLLAILSEHVPAWKELFTRVVMENVSKEKPD